MFSPLPAVGFLMLLVSRDAIAAQDSPLLPAKDLPLSAPPTVGALPDANLTAPQAPSATAGTPEAVETEELERLAREAITRKEFTKARDIYRELAGRQPDNIDYVLSIAQMSSWLHDYSVAQISYDQVLAAQPENVQAMLGKAQVFMWQQQYALARPWLDRAQAAAPGSSEVGLAFARFYHYQGQEKEAWNRVQAVLAKEPGNPEALELSRQIELPRPIEINTGYERSRLSPIGTSGNRKFLSVGYIGSSGRVDIGYERWARFGEISNRLLLSTSQRFREKWSVRGGIFLAPNATVIPTQEYTFGVARQVSRRVVLGLDYRYSRLPGAKIHTLAPTLELYFPDASWLQATYYRGSTSFRGPSGAGSSDNSFAVRYNRQISEPLAVYVGYGQGRESFQTFLRPSLDRIASFDANTYLAGARWQVSKNYGLNLYWVRQNRSTGAHETTTGISLSTRQ